MRLEYLSEFKYLGWVLDELGMDEKEGRRKVASGRVAAGAIRFLVNARNLQLECAKVLHETLLVSVLMYESETIEGEISIEGCADEQPQRIGRY